MADRARIVVDTNVWVSMLLPGGMRRVGEHIEERKDIVLVSEDQLAEINRVLAYPRIAKLVPAKRAQEFLSAMAAAAVLVKVRSVVKLCRDPEDDHILALCLDGKADWLITGDKDLLVLEQFRHTGIIAPQAYLSL